MGVNLNFSPHSQRTEESEICLAEVKKKDLTNASLMKFQSKRFSFWLLTTSNQTSNNDQYIYKVQKILIFGRDEAVGI
jgi:hypothetical protein